MNKNKMKKQAMNQLVIEADKSKVSEEEQEKDIISRAFDIGYEWLVVTRSYDFPCDGDIKKDRHDVVCDIADCLACHVEIVAVYHGLIRLAEADIQEMKKEAMSMLGPISRAKANGLL